jgi:hypothetical protein
MSTPGPTPTNGLQSAQQQLDELEVLIQRMLTLPSEPPENSPLPELGDVATPPSAPPPAPPPEPPASVPSVPALAQEVLALPDFEESLPPLLEEFAAPAALPPVFEEALPGVADPARPARMFEDDLTPLPSFEFGHDGIETSDYLPPPDLSAPPEPGPVSWRDIVRSEAPPTEEERTRGADKTPRPVRTGGTFSAREPEEVKEPGGVRHAPARRGVLIRANQAFDRWTYPLGATGHCLRSAEGRDILGWFGIALLMVALVWGVLDWMGWIW